MPISTATSYLAHAITLLFSLMMLLAFPRKISYSLKASLMANNYKSPFCQLGPQKLVLSINSQFGMALDFLLILHPRSSEFQLPIPQWYDCMRAIYPFYIFKLCLSLKSFYQISITMCYLFEMTCVNY